MVASKQTNGEEAGSAANNTGFSSSSRHGSGDNVSEEGTQSLPTSNHSDGVEDLSQLLLQGWTMLAETCPMPSCHMPLARSRSGRVVCCNCHAEVAIQPPSGRARPESVQPTTQETEEVSVRNSTENVNQQMEVSTATNTNGINNGVSDSSGSHTCSPGPNNETIENNREGIDSSSRAIVTASSTRVRNASSSRDAVSAAMGEKLLTGWTMLSAACDHCGTPLMRDNGQNVICVGCEIAGVNNNGNRGRSSTDTTNTHEHGRLVQSTRGNNGGNRNNTMDRTEDNEMDMSGNMNLTARRLDVQNWNAGRLLDNNRMRGLTTLGNHGIPVSGRELPRLRVTNSEVPRLPAGRSGDVPRLPHVGVGQVDDIGQGPIRSNGNEMRNEEEFDEEVIYNVGRLRAVVDEELNRTERAAAMSLRKLRSRLNEETYVNADRVKEIHSAMAEGCEVIYKARCAYKNH